MSRSGEGAPGRVAVVVVNYGTADLAAEAVSSVLARFHGGRPVEVHLVDNASPGDDAARLAARAAGPDWRDAVAFRAEPVNHGFGRGNNLVLRALAARADPPEMVFLLNPDARLENEAIDLLAARLEREPSLGFAGAAISKPGEGPVTAAFRFPGLVSEVSQALAFGPVHRATARWHVPLPPDHPDGPVDWVAGAAVMIRMQALRDLHFFDPGFFLYYEEVDLMRRGRLRGWGTAYVPEARVVHSEGAATGVRSGESGRPRRPAYWYESWSRYFRRSHGRAGALLIGAGVLAAAGLHVPLARLRGRAPALPARFLPDFWSAALRPLLRGDGPAP